MIREKLADMGIETSKLSKSKYLAWLQCGKRLYLESFHPEKKDEISIATKMLWENGSKVGRLAREFIPGGVLVDTHDSGGVEARKRTHSLVLEEKVSAIYEGEFEFEEIKIRVDILRNNGDGTYDLIEVKSTTGLKDIHLDDLGVQIFVLKGCGVKLKRCFLLHLDRNYKLRGGDYEISKLFKMRDLTVQVGKRMKFITRSVREAKDLLDEESVPHHLVGNHCNNPYRCSFYDYCHKNLPASHIINLPRISQDILDVLQAKGVEEISKIPVDFSMLSPLQRRVRAAVDSNEIFYDRDLYDVLLNLQFPLYFIDFETLSSALPIYKGTTPYLQVPFQWSAHVLSESNELAHYEFLAQGNEDPRKEFTTKLLDLLSNEGSVIVYSSFEESRLREIARTFKEFSPKVSALLRRTFDLLDAIRKIFLPSGL